MVDKLFPLWVSEVKFETLWFDHRTMANKTKIRGMSAKHDLNWDSTETKLFLVDTLGCKEQKLPFPVIVGFIQS